MNEDPRLPPLLLGLFQHLVANGVPVGLRDYLDGLRALELGAGGHERRQLRELAQALWARTEPEQRLIARWFDAAPLPPTMLTESVQSALTAAAAVDSNPRPDVAVENAFDATSTSGDSSLPLTPIGALDSLVAKNARARLSFASAREGGGLPIPRVAAKLATSEQYVLNPQPLISERELTVLWRRYRRGTRRGPRIELDIGASIRERSRRGLLSQPIRRAKRSNSARLLVLADASPSMDPWRPFLSTLANSLELGRLARFELRYFTNVPRKQLYETGELVRADKLDDVLRRNLGASVLVVSDAGSARGYLNRRRFVQTNSFLHLANKLLSGLVWLNPMPRVRWTRTTAALIAAAPGVTMLPLSTGQVLRAIDILRGRK